MSDRGHASVATSLAERLEHTSAVLEVWHCMPKHQTTTMASSSSDGSHMTHAVFGRRMGGALHDVLLGSTEVPLSPLLMKHTGSLVTITFFMPLYFHEFHELAVNS